MTSSNKPAPDGGTLYPPAPKTEQASACEVIVFYGAVAILSVISIGLLAAGTDSIYLYFYH